MASATDVQDHLRGASDAILLLTDEVRQLEEHKRGIRPGDPRFEELATAVRRAAEALALFTREEESWAEQSTTARDPDTGKKAAELKTISRTNATAPLTAILERWRAIERKLNEADPGSPEAKRLFQEFEHVRDEYLEAFEVRERSPD